LFYNDINNISKQSKRVTVKIELNKVNISNICTRGPQSLSSLRARRDHDPALQNLQRNVANYHKLQM